MIYEFGPCLLNTQTHELSREGAKVPVEPLTLRLIQYLAENPDRVVSKDELLADVWHGRNVTDWVISAAIKAARLALGDTQSPRQIIRTVHASGFRFIAQITARGQGSTDTQPSMTLLVRPFDMLSDEEDQSYFSDGLSEDLITDLSHIAGLRVVTRHTSQMIKSGQLTVEEVSKQLRITHILEGAVRREADQVRVNAQLVSTSSVEPLWSERFSGAGTGIFDLQDSLCERIVSALSLHLTPHESRKGTNNPLAYDNCLKGRSQYYRYAPPHMAAALAHFEKASELDPNYAKPSPTRLTAALHCMFSPGLGRTRRWNPRWLLHSVQWSWMIAQRSRRQD